MENTNPLLLIKIHYEPKNIYFLFILKNLNTYLWPNVLTVLKEVYKSLRHTVHVNSVGRHCAVSEI